MLISSTVQSAACQRLTLSVQVCPFSLLRPFSSDRGRLPRTMLALSGILWADCTDSLRANLKPGRVVRPPPLIGRGCPSPTPIYVSECISNFTRGLKQGEGQRIYYLDAPAANQGITAEYMLCRCCCGVDMTRMSSCSTSTVTGRCPSRRSASCCRRSLTRYTLHPCVPTGPTTYSGISSSSFLHPRH